MRPYWIWYFTILLFDLICYWDVKTLFPEEFLRFDWSSRVARPPCAPDVWPDSWFGRPSFPFLTFWLFGPITLRSLLRIRTTGVVGDPARDHMHSTHHDPPGTRLSVLGPGRMTCIPKMTIYAVSERCSALISVTFFYYHLFTLIVRNELLVTLYPCTLLFYNILAIFDLNRLQNTYHNT